jgi:hypothetical protein
MAKDRVRKRGKLGWRFKTFKETRRDAKKSRDALRKRITKRLAKIWSF